MTTSTHWPEAVTSRVPKGMRWSDRVVRLAYLLMGWVYRNRFAGDTPPPSDLARTILVNACIEGVGNMLLFTPVLQVLRRAFPQAQVTAMAYDNAAGELLVASPLIDSLHRVSPSKRAVVRQIEVLRQRRWDLVVNVDTHWTGLVFAVVPAQFSVSHTVDGLSNQYGLTLRQVGLYTRLVPIRPGVHEVEYNLDLVRALGVFIDPADARPTCWLPEEAEIKAMELLKKVGCQGESLIAFHPGTSPTMAWKRWPPERFAAVADALIARGGKKVLLLGSAQDLSICDFVQEQMEHEGINLAGRTTIFEAAAVIRRCDLFVGNVSGLMHLAAAQGVPVVAVAGPDDFLRGGPVGEVNRVVDSGGECQRCQALHPRMPTLCPFDRACLMDITAYQVLQAAESLLDLGATRLKDGQAGLAREKYETDDRAGTRSN